MGRGIALGALVLLAIGTACSGEDSASEKITSPAQLADRVGCKGTYQDMSQHIGFPQYMKAYGACDMDGHRVFFTIVKSPGQQAALRTAAATPDIPGVDLDHWLSADNWQIEVPEAKPGEIRRLRDALHAKNADMRE